jgi:hypothetical protein
LPILNRSILLRMLRFWEYVTSDRPKEALWVVTLSRRYPAQFAKPVDLRVDLSADENGKAVHTDCYVTRLKSSSDADAVRAD